MSGILNPALPDWTRQKTTISEAATGASVTEVWTGPEATRETWSATKPFGESHPSYSASLLRRKERDADPSQTMATVTLYYEPPPTSSDMPPSGSEFLDVSVESYTDEVDVNPLTPSEGKKTVEGIQFVYRLTKVDAGSIDISDLTAFTLTGASARPSGITGGTAANWSSSCESARKENGVREIVTRHVYRP